MIVQGGTRTQETWKPKTEDYQLRLPKPCEMHYLVAQVLGPETSGGFYEYSSLLCLLVTALSFTTTAGSEKLKEFARVAVISTAITKFN